MKSSMPSPQPPAISGSVTVIIPALNESGNLERLLLAVEQTFHNLGKTLPVLLIDDGSTDNSPQLLKRLIQHYSWLKVIRHPHRRGVTGVWKTALAHTNSDWLYWGQADLESDFRTDLPLLLNACVAGVDGVAGWRQQRGDGKILASSFANSACRCAYGLKIHDMNWIKLVRRDILAALPLDLVTHRFLLAILAGWGYQITEVPTPWHPRFSGQSKFGKGRLLASAIAFWQVWWWFQTRGRRVKSAHLEYITPLHKDHPAQNLVANA